MRKDPAQVIEKVYAKFNEQNNNSYKKRRITYAIQKRENIRIEDEELILSRLIKYVDEKERAMG
ncbi:hypothetical protein ABH897_004679 [Paenibacillus sp. RC73]|uniref:hypothetical protein n=1 Tax=Paenibacillus sp. RC73 TaxID=3156250 RepID=UPI00383356D8